MAHTVRPAARLALLLLLVPACGDRSTHVYPEETTRNFLEACTERAPAPVCRCSLDALQDRFTAAEFAALEERMRAGEIPKVMMDTVADCGR
jgi:hypothetical protein